MRLDYAAQSQEFDNIWENRSQPPYVMGSWTDNDWAKGRTQYPTFLIKVNEEGIREKVEAIQCQLSKFECIDVLPPDYLHLTVKETGRFLVDHKENDDEYTPQELDAICENAKRVIRSFEPFEVKLERLNNFTSVVCVEGHDGGVIRSINKMLRDEIGINMLQYDPAFLPHMSIAQYKNDNDFPRLITRLEKIRDTEIGTLKVENIQLVIANLPTDQGHPRIEIIKEYSLKH